MLSLSNMKLTPSEKRCVLTYAALGTQEKVAEVLCVAATTVKTHINNANQKKHCSFSMQLIPVCLLEGDITLDELKMVRDLYHDVLPN